MEHSGADDLVELASKLVNTFDRNLLNLKIIKVVLALQRPGMLQAGRTGINPRNAGVWLADGVFCCLGGPTAGDQDFQVFPISNKRPH